MPSAIKRHKLPMLQPRLKELQPRIKTLGIKTLKQKQQANGRTLALDGAAWRKLRTLVLSSEPLCRHCTARGLTVIATDLDHRDNNPANNDLLNLMPLCHECHSRKTAKDMGHNVRMGCDMQGMPLDQGHHWNKPASAVLVSADGADDEKSPATEEPQTDWFPSVSR